MIFALLKNLGDRFPNKFLDNYLYCKAMLLNAKFKDALLSETEAMPIKGKIVEEFGGSSLDINEEHGDLESPTSGNNSTSDFSIWDAEGSFKKKTYTKSGSK